MSNDIKSRLKLLREGHVEPSTGNFDLTESIDEELVISGLIYESEMEYISQSDTYFSESDNIDIEVILEAASQRELSSDEVKSIGERLKRYKEASDPVKALREVRMVRERMSKVRNSVLLFIFINQVLGIIYYFSKNNQIAKMSPSQKKQWLDEANAFRKETEKLITQAKRDNESSRVKRYEKALEVLDKNISRFKLHAGM